jgi:hypothetical protein
VPKLIYEPLPPTTRQGTLDMIELADQIANEYARQGYTITLRQLYYQFVARGHLANLQANYKRLGNAVNLGRLGGRIDWNHVTDRTRNLASLPTWDSPSSIIDAAANGYRIDRWEGQLYRPEVWVEKEALAGVIGREADQQQAPYFACRGYVSQSEMWAAGMRFVRYRRNGLIPVVIHLGDHDPSGIDMSRDIQTRLALFCGGHGFEPPRFERIALNRDQIEQYDPPPNPAKQTDSRFEDYLAEHGDQSWELDALEPTVLADLVRQTVGRYVNDPDAWQARQDQQEHERADLLAVAHNWDDVTTDYGADGEGN